MKIGVIGCGNMAAPIVRTISKNDKSIEFFTYTPSKARAKELALEIGGVNVEELELFPDMDLWLIGCKPQQLKTLGDSLKGRLAGQDIISILASTSFSSLEKHLGTKSIIRIMPNTPSAFGKGVSLMISNEVVRAQSAKKVFEIFNYCGEVIKANTEKEFDELTVFSGSGPAYIFRFALSYYKKLIKMGFDADVSRKLIDQLFLGSSELMLNEPNNYESMVSKVTSKGGVTIEAIKVLELSGIDAIVESSIDAAINRGEQISQLNN